MKEKLLRCPFCGGEPCVQEYIFHGYTSTYGVVCLDCCCETRQFFTSEAKAIEIWNRRTNNAKLDRRNNEAARKA